MRRLPGSLSQRQSVVSRRSDATGAGGDSMSLRLRNRWQYRGKGKRGEDRWKWQAFLDDDGTGDLGRVSSVEYVLHPTFKIPRRIITDPADGFLLKTGGWGSFVLRAFVDM